MGESNVEGDFIPLDTCCIHKMLRDSLGCFWVALLGISLINVAQAAIFPAKGAVLDLTGKTWKDKSKGGVSASYLSFSSRLALML